MVLWPRTGEGLSALLALLIRGETISTFTPPTAIYPDSTGDWMFDMHSHAHGVTVYSLDGGATFTSTEFPYIGDLASVDPTTSKVTGPSANAKEGVTYFLGGHVYPGITAAQVSALTASGFGAYIT